MKVFQRAMAPILAAAAVVAVLSTGASAQSMDVRGKWNVQQDGRTCTIELFGDQMFGAYRASSFGCAAELFSVNRYTISGGRITLLGIGDKRLATLDMRGSELVGATESGGTVTLRRAGAPPVVTAQPSWGGPGYGPAAGCVTHGFENRCASQFDLQAPAPGSQVRTLTMLNVRRGPSLSQDAIGSLPQNACVRVEECQTTSEGLWCRINLYGQSGWITKVVQNRQRPGSLITYANRC